MAAARNSFRRLMQKRSSWTCRCADPEASLVEDSSRDLFGATSGGAANDRTLFEVAHGSTLTTHTTGG